MKEYIAKRSEDDLFATTECFLYQLDSEFVILSMKFDCNRPWKIISYACFIILALQICV